MGASEGVATDAELTDGAGPRSTAARARRHAERELSALVVAIEFTLISVMVGVVLFPLTESAAHLLRDLEVEFWPYLVCGLALTLYMWASVIGHSLTFIGWPIDLGHNLLYIVVAVGLAIQFQFAADPVGWFATSAAASVLVTLTILYDLRLIRHRLRRARGAAAELFTAVLAAQQWQLRMSPWYLFVAFLPLVLVLTLPELFLHQRGHLALITLQLVAVLWALVRAIRLFGTWAEPIMRQAMAELESELPGN